LRHEPCPFLTDLNRNFPVCSIIRPVSPDPTAPGAFGAVTAVNGLMADGLFNGHKKTDGFVNFVLELAEEADEARRQC